MQATKSQQTIRRDSGRRKGDFTSSTDGRMELAAELLDRIYDPIRDEMHQVGQNLKDLGRDQSPFLSQILDHVMDNTGKRLRPALALLASRFHPYDRHAVETMASAVELLHVAALVHDDFLDNSNIRRGRATIGSLWGRNAAVLVGDFVLATAAKLVCDTGDIRVMQLFAQATVQLSSGELHEMAGAYNWRQSREDYLQRIHDKTASLFATTGEAGAILSGAPEPITEALRDYGFNLGMAFQIVDDILDFDATREEMGKPVGNDLAQGIMTLPAIIAVERYPDDDSISRLFRKPGDDDRLDRAVALVQDSSVIEESYAVAGQFCETALERIAVLEENPARESLEELVTYLVNRRG